VVVLLPLSDPPHPAAMPAVASAASSAAPTLIRAPLIMLFVLSSPGV
jgi:hypothetical protein